jgi:hypothetical protein
MFAEQKHAEIFSKELVESQCTHPREARARTGRNGRRGVTSGSRKALTIFQKAE